MMKIFGLRNCNTCIKALKWLRQSKVDFEYFDIREVQLTKFQIDTWANIVGWDKLVNKRGSTWRNLPTDIKENLNKEKLVRLVLTHRALIKRPVFVDSRIVIAGFSIEQKNILTNYFKEFKRSSEQPC